MSWFEVLFGVQADGRSGGPRPRAHLHALGEAVRCGEVEVTLVSFGPRVVVGGPTLPEGKALWAGLVAVTNVSERPAHYADHVWRLYDLEDFAYEPFSYAGLAQEPRLQNSYLAPGARARGYLTFQLPESAVPGRISHAHHGGVADFAVPREPELPEP